MKKREKVYRSKCLNELLEDEAEMGCKLSLRYVMDYLNEMYQKDPKATIDYDEGRIWIYYEDDETNCINVGSGYAKWEPEPVVERVEPPLTFDEKVREFANKNKENLLAQLDELMGFDPNKPVKVWACKRCGKDCTETADGNIRCANPNLETEGCPYGD